MSAGCLINISVARVTPYEYKRAADLRNIPAWPAAISRLGSGARGVRPKSLDVDDVGVAPRPPFDSSTQICESSQHPPHVCPLKPAMTSPARFRMQPASSIPSTYPVAFALNS